MKKRYLHLSDSALGKALTMDELFDWMFYTRLQSIASENHIKTLTSLATIEKKHYEFWKNFFNSDITQLSFDKRLKLSVLLLIIRVFGEGVMFLIIESNERFAIQKYLAVWERYKNDTKAEGIKEILIDEFKNQEAIVGDATERKINGDTIRNIFLGFNDGLVELLGAVSGFFIAFSHVSSVIIAGLTVAFAGAISMAAGVYVSESSDKEIDDIERDKKKFLGEHYHEGSRNKLTTLSLIVGISYIIGAFVPISPVLFGTKSIYISALMSALMIVIVSYILSYLSGMEVRRRIIMNLVIISSAVVLSSLIGYIIKLTFGIDV